MFKMTFSIQEGLGERRVEFYPLVRRELIELTAEFTADVTFLAAFGHIVDSRGARSTNVNDKTLSPFFDQ